MSDITIAMDDLLINTSTDAVLFKFLEQYLERLEGPLVLQVWGRYVQLVKDITGSSKEFKPQHYPGLRYAFLLSLILRSGELYKVYHSTCGQAHANDGNGGSTRSQRAARLLGQASGLERHVCWALVRLRILDTAVDKGYPGHRRQGVASTWYALSISLVSMSDLE